MTKRLEQTILNVVKHEFQLLDSFKDDVDNLDFLSAWQRLTGLVQLAHIHNSGLSEPVTTSIMEIESKANRLVGSKSNDSNNKLQIGNFLVNRDLFDEVKNLMQTDQEVKTGERPKIDDELVINFLSNNQHILGSIVGYDEVDTEDRNQIWDALK